MKRYFEDFLKKQLSPKITLLSGPRQVGKTTLAKQLNSNFSYYNYDVQKSSRVFLNQEWDTSTDLVIFDELHKKKNWKLWLKGLYDSDAFEKQSAIVTGSARLSHIKKVGDSLAGRFYEYRLYPLDLKELKTNKTDTLKNYKRLIERGGFPEPFLKLDLDSSRRWRKTHTDTILRQDLLNLEVVKDLDSIEVLMELLSTRVGSLVSYNSLAEDLKVSDLTIKRWLRLLEDLYVVFRVSSYAKNITRGLSKSGKYYFYDLARIQGEASAIFENCVALSLKKECDFISDTKGLKTNLFFLRDKEKREIDFFVEIEKKHSWLIEAKLNDENVSKNFETFYSQLRKKSKLPIKQVQLVCYLDQRYDSKSSVAVENGLTFLENLNLLA